MKNISAFSIIVLVALLSPFEPTKVLAKDRTDRSSGINLLGLSIAEIAELRKYESEEHYVTTTDGYIIQVTRVRNPLITDYSRKLPVLIIHGLLSSGTNFVASSANARPRDYSHLNATQMSEEQLQALLEDDPSANSMAFLASNFGHEVWILNRRGNPGSKGHVGKYRKQLASYSQTESHSMMKAMRNMFGSMKVRIGRLINKLAGMAPKVKALNDENTIANYTFNPNYWNFSLDEEAKYDVPEVVDYVLKATNQTRLNAIGHSAGGALIMMSLATYPELNSKISVPALWSPAIYLNIDVSNKVIYGLQAAVSPILRRTTGPFVPEPINRLLRTLAARLSAMKLTRKLLVRPIFNLIVGHGGNQQAITSGFFNFVPASTSAHEFDQFYQVMTVGKGKMHTYDFHSASANLAAYGSVAPIVYNVSRITNTNMNFWYGNKDTLVAPENRFRLYKDLTVPFNANYIDGPDILFNHLQFVMHKNVAQLLNIPTLMAID